MEGGMHVLVSVLGDVGRSPRMQYHALSLLEAGHQVTLLGYKGETLIPELRGRESLSVVRFEPPTFSVLRKVPPLYFAWRIATLTSWLLWALFISVPKKPRPPDCIIVQNPPAIPLLLITFFYIQFLSIAYGKKPGFIIDWHNLGYSMLRPGIVQRAARLYEKWLAPFADAHFTVTKAMKQFLHQEMKISRNSQVQVLYDCPPSMFRKLSVKEQHELLARLDEELCKVCPRAWYDIKHDNAETILTKRHSETDYRPRSGRPALVVSSTSWTPDEDFGILLDALVALDSAIESRKSNLKCLVVVTGKGPQKEMYLEKISKLGMQHIAVQTLWLEPEDYPKILACADLGISLHTSTSGLDLPMKVLDLFGCQVPVCAVNFPCLPELVHDAVNGRIFESSDDLSSLLWELLSPMEPTECENHSFGDLNKYSAALDGWRQWRENWSEHAESVIHSVSP